jgi:hypothetical protein
VVSAQVLSTRGQREASSGSSSSVATSFADKIDTAVSSANLILNSLTTAQFGFPQVNSSKVLIVSTPLITGAQVTPELDADSSASPTIVVRNPFYSPATVTVGTSLLSGSLPTLKISTSFEPHLRQASVKKLQSLVVDFQHAIGRPEVSLVREELKDTLFETYRQAVAAPETRSFATAVSMIQGFLRPHWSDIPQEKLAGVADKLGWLDAQRDLSSATLSKFYRDLGTVIGSGISVEAPVEQDDDAQDDDGEEPDDSE